MDVLIVGAGAIGRWFAGTIEAGTAFADTDPDDAEAAADRLGGRAVPLDTAERFEAVVIAVPMRATTDAIADHAANATEAVLDLAGVMTGPIEAMEAHAPGLERASLHPLFAPENAPGRIAMAGAEVGPVVGAIREALEAEGNELLETTPAEHDRAMETIQARTHAAVLAFGLAADDVPEGFGTPIYDTLEELREEVTGGSPRVYADIQATFEGATDVADAARRIATADEETFEQLYLEAGEHSKSHASSERSGTPGE